MMTSPAQPIMPSILPGLPLEGREAGVPRSRPTPGDCGRPRGLLGWGMLLLVIFVLGLQTAPAQDQHKRKVPIVDKLSAGSRQAFTGKLETLDLQHHVMELNATESKSLEIFPVKKGISVTSADGEKMSLSQLKPGNEVIVYYEQKGDRRTVKDIVLLTAGSTEKPKKSAPPS